MSLNTWDALGLMFWAALLAVAAWSWWEGRKP
jgi:hypothetical protein